MIVTRSIEFPMGHRLQAHGGLCRHVHGHNYKVVVEVEGEPDSEQGMIIDFSDLKREMEDVFKKYDHALVLQETDPLWSFIRNSMEAKSFGLDRVLYMKNPPSAENLARLWFFQLDVRITGLFSVTVFESSNTSARYVPEVD